jgi:hypothetical protein
MSRLQACFDIDILNSCGTIAPAWLLNDVFLRIVEATTHCAAEWQRGERQPGHETPHKLAKAWLNHVVCNSGAGTVEDAAAVAFAYLGHVLAAHGVELKDVECPYSPDIGF